uniref:Secreted protein n=1 Tax=Brassica oleracea TaxID=3712 RepID=A0A3P6A741_BRAOL|nr:unnamed protein product [Brassica oleracea]
MGEVIISYILPLLILLLAAETHAHDVTRLLAKHPFFLFIQPLPNPNSPRRRNQPENQHNRLRRRKRRHVRLNLQRLHNLDSQKHPLPPRPPRLLWRQGTPPAPRWLSSRPHSLPSHRSCSRYHPVRQYRRRGRVR